MLDDAEPREPRTVLLLLLLSLPPLLVAAAPRRRRLFGEWSLGRAERGDRLEHGAEHVGRRAEGNARAAELGGREPDEERAIVGGSDLTVTSP